MKGGHGEIDDLYDVCTVRASTVQNRLQHIIVSLCFGVLYKFYGEFTWRFHLQILPLVNDRNLLLFFPKVKVAMTERKFTNAALSLSARARPQYHYFYGSIEDGADKITEETTNELDESLFGEELVPTDHEEETPPNSREDLQHLLVTNQPAPKTPASKQLNSNIAITLLIIILATIFLLVLPRAEEPMTAEGVVPYPHIDRADFGDPVEGFISLDLFHPTLLSETKPRSFVFPFPTGAFWTNLVMKSSEEKVSYPIVVYPYAYKWAESSLLLSYPFAHRSIKERLIQHQFAPDLTISMAETAQNRYVTKFDPLSVTLRFVSSPKSKWETTLVQGSPYTTIKSLNATPTFTPLSTFKSVQCPGDDTEKFSDIIDNDLDGGRRLFGVCSIDVRTLRSDLELYHLSE